MSRNAVNPRKKREMKVKIKQEYSSDIQLEGLELAADAVAPWTPRCPTSSVLADKDIDAFLTQPTNAFRTCEAFF